MTVLFKGCKVFLNFIFCFFKLLPISNKVTFISRQSDEISTDMQMLADEMSREDPIVQTIFLCRTIPPGIVGKLKYVCHLFRQMYHIATSKVVILDSYCMGVSLLKQRKSLLVVQIWHALGALKKFGYSILDEGEGHSRKISEVMNMHRHYDMIISSSTLCAPYFAEAFNYGLESVEIASLPRVDLLTDQEYQKKVKDRILKQYPTLADRETIVYAPTFRKESRYNQESLERLLEAVDLSRYNLVVKAHPLMDVKQYAEMPGVLYDKKFSTIEMFATADYVIADYSAVIYEAALMNKPLFFYTYDMKEYQGNRDFYIDYQAEMPGVISTDAGDIFHAIAEGRYDMERVENFAQKYVEIRQNCTEDLVKKIWISSTKNS